MTQDEKPCCQDCLALAPDVQPVHTQWSYRSVMLCARCRLGREGRWKRAAGFSAKPPKCKPDPDLFTAKGTRPIPVAEKAQECKPVPIVLALKYIDPEGKERIIHLALDGWEFLARNAGNTLMLRASISQADLAVIETAPESINPQETDCKIAKEKELADAPIVFSVNTSKPAGYYDGRNDKKSEDGP